MKRANRTPKPFFVALGWILASNASAATTEYVCAARIDCGAPRFPSTQDIPSNDTPIVQSDSVETAKAMCMTRYTGSYLRLAKSLAAPESIFQETKSCKILSEALPVSDSDSDSDSR